LLEIDVKGDLYNQQLARSVEAYREHGITDAVVNALIYSDDRVLQSWAESSALNVPKYHWLLSGDGLPQPFSCLANWYFEHASGGLPSCEWIDPVELRPFLGFLLILDVLSAEKDYRYRLYGSRIAKRVGFDCTGKTLRQLSELRPSAAQLFHLTYDAVCRCKKALFTEHVPRGLAEVSMWRRLVLPFSGTPDGDGVTRLLVLNVPTGHGHERQLEKALRALE